MKSFVVHLIVLGVLLAASRATELEMVSDEDLVHLIKRHSYAVVLFCKIYLIESSCHPHLLSYFAPTHSVSAKKNCDKCDDLESKVSNLVEDFKEHLDAITVKAFNSQLVRLYNPTTKEPALVFFRHGIPILYEGPLDEDTIVHYFSENKEPTVRELNDKTFEHLTQATSGSTTGDWFIML